MRGIAIDNFPGQCGQPRTSTTSAPACVLLMVKFLLNFRLGNFFLFFFLSKFKMLNVSLTSERLTQAESVILLLVILLSFVSPVDRSHTRHRQPRGQVPTQTSSVPPQTSSVPPQTSSAPWTGPNPAVVKNSESNIACEIVLYFFFNPNMTSSAH